MKEGPYAKVCYKIKQRWAVDEIHCRITGTKYISETKRAIWRKTQLKSKSDQAVDKVYSLITPVTYTRLLPFPESFHTHTHVPNAYSARSPFSLS